LAIGRAIREYPRPNSGYINQNSTQIGSTLWMPEKSPMTI
jgi:hypothetical protein